FCREVGNARLRGLIGAVRVEVRLELGLGAGQLTTVARVARGLVQADLIGGAQQQDRVVVGRLPAGRVEPPEQAVRLVVPGPAQVVRQVFEGGQGGRDRRYDGKRARWSNHMHPSEMPDL